VVSVMAVWLRRAVQLLLLGVFFVGLITAREIQRGERALRASDEAFHRGDLETSVLHARTGAVAYAPGAPHVDAAYQRLEAIARGAEAEGRHALARTAWGAVRSAALQTSHWWVTRSEELERAQVALARLNRAAALRAEAGMLARPEPSTSAGDASLGNGVEGGARGTAWGEAHAASHGAKLLRIGLLALGFGALLLGLAWAGWRVIDEAGEVQRRGLSFALALCLAGTACWLFVVLTG
jgi:hypothetical protein